MQLTDHEKAMRDGAEGEATAKAMDLLVRYGEALGAERLVETHNVCATITATTPFQRDIALKGGGMDAVFSEFSLDSREVVKIPKFKTFTSHLQLGFDPNQPEKFGLSEETVNFYNKSEKHAAGLGAQREPLQLAGRALRDLVHEEDLLRHLVVGGARGDEGDPPDHAGPD